MKKDQIFKRRAGSFETTCKSYKKGIYFGTCGDPESSSDMEYITHDGRYSCTRVNKLTADYMSCKRMLISYDAAKVSEQGAMMGMQVQQGLNDARVQGDYSAQSAEGNAQVAAVDAIRETARNRRNHESAKMGIFSLQAAVFTAMVVNYITPDNFLNSCTDFLCENLMDMAYEQGTSGGGHGGMGAPGLAQQLFPNQAVRAAFVGEIAKATGETIKATVLMNNYRKQANAARDIKEDMLNYEGEVNQGPIFDADVCRRNPSLPRCRIRPGVRVSNGSGFDFKGGGSQGGGGSYDLNTGEATIGEFNDEKSRRKR